MQLLTLSAATFKHLNWYWECGAFTDAINNSIIRVLNSGATKGHQLKILSFFSTDSCSSSIVKNVPACKYTQIYLMCFSCTSVLPPPHPTGSVELLGAMAHTDTLVNNFLIFFCCVFVLPYSNFGSVTGCSKRPFHSHSQVSEGAFTDHVCALYWCTIFGPYNARPSPGPRSKVYWNQENVCSDYWQHVCSHWQKGKIDSFCSLSKTLTVDFYVLYTMFLQGVKVVKVRKCCLWFLNLRSERVNFLGELGDFV